MQPRSFAALYHGVGWDCPEDNIIVSAGVTMGNFKSSPINTLYERLCTENKVDEGDPFNYEVYALFTKKQKEEMYFDFGSSYSLIDQYSNVLALHLGQPISMCRLLWSDDNFKSITSTERIYYSTEVVSNVIGDKNITLSEQNVKDIKRLWGNVRKLYRNYDYNGRLINILTYYYAAWRSHSIEQIIINLAIVLEIIFAPHSQSEVSHQVSFNISKYLGNNRDERVDIYNTIRNFYRMRSAIIHGGIPGFDKIESVAAPVYAMVTKIVLSIFSNVNKIEIFSDDKQRRDMLFDFLFE